MQLSQLVMGSRQQAALSPISYPPNCTHWSLPLRFIIIIIRLQGMKAWGFKG